MVDFNYYSRAQLSVEILLEQMPPSLSDLFLAGCIALVRQLLSLLINNFFIFHVQFIYLPFVYLGMWKRSLTVNQDVA